MPVARVEYQAINLSGLARLSGATAGPEQFAAAGLVKHADRRIKLLAGGTISKKLTLKVHAASAAATAAVEAAGGKVEIIAMAKTPSKKATRPQTETPEQQPAS